jgi:2-polyprenyl-6-methoxyphenol hydroxylase-like FAD-dependent oxidoreductase
VIGADGVNSVVRNHVCPGERAIDTGYTVIRGISDHELEAGYAFETWGRGELAGGVALPGGRSYWFYEAPTKSIDRASPLRALGAGSWPAPTGEQVAQTPPGTVLVHRILRLRPLAAWTRGTVALLGDAAHAMEPNLGQGAAQTVEDAEAMLAALKTGADLPRALAAYAAERRRRAEFLQRESTRAARTALSTLSGPRDVFARLVPEIVQRAMLERLLRRHASPRSLSPGSSRERTRCPG